MIFKTALATIGILVVGALTLAPAAAEDAKRPLGNWVRQVGENTLTFEIKKDVMRGVAVLGGNTIEIDCDYGVSKDGTLFARISKVTKKDGTDGPAEGELLAFKYSVNGDMMTLSDWKSTLEGTQSKQLVEGDYKLKAK